MNRRQALLGFAAAGVSLSAGAGATAAPRRLAKKSGVDLVAEKPLPFKPSSLTGLSKELLESHHDKNYAGAVRKLNRVRKELAGLPDDAPGFVRGALLGKELTFRNSVVLHELYFENLGGSGAPSGGLQKALSGAFGSLARFEAELARAALTQAGGSGWTLLTYDLQTGAPRLSTSAGHAESPAMAVPLLALDMYEHSYAIDYGADAKRYVEAFWRNINWPVVDRRLDRARRAAQALRGP